MNDELLNSRLDYLHITEEAIKHFSSRKEEAIINRNNAIANNQDGAKQLYEEKIKLAGDQVNFYMSVKDKVVTELITNPKYVAYLQEIGMMESKTDIQMR